MTFTKLFSSLNNRFSSHLTHKVYVNRGIELSLPYIHFSKYRLFGVNFLNGIRIIFLACYVSNTSVSYSWKILLVHICFIFGKEKKVYWSLLFYVIYCNHKKMSRVVYGNENSNLYIKHHHLLLQRQLFSHFYPFTWNISNKKDHLHYSF